MSNNIIEKIEEYACGYDDNNRVVAVEFEQENEQYEKDEYIKTTIVIYAMDDEKAHELDNQKWRDGKLMDYLSRKLEENNCEST